MGRYRGGFVPACGLRIKSKWNPDVGVWQILASETRLRAKCGWFHSITFIGFLPSVLASVSILLMRPGAQAAVR